MLLIVGILKIRQKLNLNDADIISRQINEQSSTILVIKSI